MEEDLKYYKTEILPLLEKLGESAENNSKIWWSIWDILHHQGDVFDISYFAVPRIFEFYKERNWLDANLPALLSTIEICRQNESNPKLSEWLVKEYFQTLEKAVIYCANKISENWDRDLLISYLMLVSAVKQKQGIYELLDIALSDEKYLLELYENS